MAIGGSKFLLEKTWKTSSGSSTTFNSPGNIVIPYGKYDITVTGRGGSGSSGAPSSISNYNPNVPGSANYNPIVPGNANYNPIVPGTATFNPGNPSQGFNVTGNVYRQVRLVAFNNFFYPYAPPVYGYNQFCPSPETFYFVYIGPTGYEQQYDTITYTCAGPVGWPGNATGSSNPPSGGNYSGANPSSGGNYESGNPAVPGNANYNAATNPSSGTPTTVLGVAMPGGNLGQVASVVPPTTINRYQFPDGTTYPVTVPTGSYVTIQTS